MDSEASRTAREAGHHPESGNLFATLSGIKIKLCIVMQCDAIHIFILVFPSVSSDHGGYCVRSFLQSATLLSYAEV